MESLRGLPEAIEADFGDSIVARDEAIAVLGNTPGLGPPDLCWLQKRPKRSGFFGGSEESQGYYHYVLGRDVCSSAAVAAYFALLNSKVEQRSMLQGLWGQAEVVIERGFYCCYDLISRMDVRCELCVPGGVAVGVVDAAGQLHETTPHIWQQAQVSAFVRAMLYDPEMRLNGGSVIAYDPCATGATEATLLCSVLDLYSRGTLPGALQELADEQGYGVAAEHMDLVLAALWQHFRRRQRWQAAADFFRELAQLYSPATLLLAAAERAVSLSGSAAAAGAVTLSSLLVRPSKGPAAAPAPHLVPATMVGLGLELLQQGEAEAAASLARRALSACPRCRPAWLLLARCFVAERQFAAALVALNVVPTPPLPAAEVELLHVVPPPAPKATTQPQVHLYDGELEAARVCALEEASLDGSRLLAYLPGSILVNKEPLGAAYQLDICPNRITRSVLTAVYELLQAIVKEVGWDKFLEIRSRVFLMQHEVAQSPAAHASGGNAQQQQQLHRLSSSEPTPSGAAAQHASSASPGADLVALQVMQQAALLRKLEQLGLSADTPHTTSSPATEASVQATTSPPRTSAGSGVRIGTPPTAPTSAGGAGGGLPLLSGHTTSGSAGPTPPASRGRSSGGGAGSHRGGGSPQSYYASRLQEELAKPLGGPGSAGGSTGSPAAAAALPYSQLTVRVPGERQATPQRQQQQTQQQAHQQQQQTQRAAASASAGGVLQAPGAAPSTAAPAPRAPGTPGGGQRSMAGRVLLLGKKSGPRTSTTSSSSRQASSRSAVPVGCGVPRTLAPNEVEDLSKYATASNVAPLRVPAVAGVNPELWNTVFGGPSSSSSRAAPAAGAAAAVRAAVDDDDDDDGLSATAAGLPRIRTRPLGEAVEDEVQDNYWLSSSAGTKQAAAGWGSSNAAAAAGAAAGRHKSYSSSMGSFLCGQGSSRTSRHTQGSGATRKLWGCVSPHATEDGLCHGSSSSSAAVTWQQQQQPLGEGLDRTTSLLNRTVSNASAAGSTGPLPLTGSLRTGGSLGLHGSGSGQLGSARPRRVSLVGEAANRSLEADREGLTKGWVHDDTSAQTGWGGVDGVGSPGAGGRRLCVRWLDELIVALWHDLQAHMEWKVVDQALREARGGTAAELALGLVSTAPTPTAQPAAAPTAAVPGVSDGGALEPPVLTCADWMRRGALAERLGHSLDARSAYRVAVKLAFNLTSYMALMRLEAEADSIASTALCASQVLSWHQQRAGQLGAAGSGGSSSSAQADAGQGGSSGAAGAAAGGSGDLVLMGVPPADVVWALGMAVDGSSMQEVQRAMSDVPPAAQAMLLATVEQWQKWQQFKVQPALAARRR